MALKDYSKAQELFDKVPELLEKKKIGGKDLPTEVFIKKKRMLSHFQTGCASIITRLIFSAILQGKANEENRQGIQICRDHKNQPCGRARYL